MEDFFFFSTAVAFILTAWTWFIPVKVCGVLCFCFLLILRSDYELATYDICYIGFHTSPFGSVLIYMHSFAVLSIRHTYTMVQGDDLQQWLKQGLCLAHAT
jgi:hypothetical protein